MRKYAIVVAGGKGLRMGGDIPKQFLPVGGLPVLMRTLRRFREYDPEINLILVLPQDHFDYWKKLCADYSFECAHTLAEGGATRFHSVKNGLEKIYATCQEDALVAVHDGVRPFVSVKTIARTFDAASHFGAAVPVVDMVDSIRMVEDGKSVACDRSKFKCVQTPQVFSLRVLKLAYDQPFRDFFTDDASVVESISVQIHLVEGNRENIKLTTTYDLKIAEVLD